MSKRLKIAISLMAAGILLLPVAVFCAYQYHDHKNAKLVALAGSKKHIKEVTRIFGEPYEAYTYDKPPSEYFMKTFGFELSQEEHAYQFYPTSKWRPCYMIFVITDASGAVLRATGYQP